MSKNTQLDMVREAANRPPYKQTVYVNAGQLLAEIEREYLPRPRREIATKHLTHKEPDSLERIEEDAKKATRIYWECYGIDRCSCPAKIDGKNPRERYGVDRCLTAMTLDLLRRQREVLERGR